VNNELVLDCYDANMYSVPYFGFTSNTKTITYSGISGNNNYFYGLFIGSYVESANRWRFGCKFDGCYDANCYDDYAQAGRWSRVVFGSDTATDYYVRYSFHVVWTETVTSSNCEDNRVYGDIYLDKVKILSDIPSNYYYPANNYPTKFYKLYGVTYEEATVGAYIDLFNGGDRNENSLAYGDYYYLVTNAKGTSYDDYIFGNSFIFNMV
jgi:hypothetical protein